MNAVVSVLFIKEVLEAVAAKTLEPLKMKKRAKGAVIIGAVGVEPQVGNVHARGGGREKGIRKIRIIPICYDPRELSYLFFSLTYRSFFFYFSNYEIEKAKETGKIEWAHT